MSLHGSLEATHLRGLRLATESDAPALRLLLNRAFKELADNGLNFTGSYQDEALTLERMRNATVYLLEDIAGVYATISLKESLSALGAKYFFISQVAVCPNRQKQGIGKFLMQFAEHQAHEAGIHVLRLNTAIPAKHLVSFYQGLGFAIIDNVQFQNKNYRSYILEKWLHIRLKTADAECALRTPTEADAPQMQELCRQLGYEVSASQIKNRLMSMQAARNQVFVLQQHVAHCVATRAALFGFVHVQKLESLLDDKAFEIVALVVNETARNRGFGAKLIEIAEEWGRLHELSRALVKSNVRRDSE